MTTNQQRQRALAHLSRDYEVYLSAEKKLRQSILACRATDLDGNPMLTFGDIAMTIGVSRQAVQQYTKRWGAGSRG